MKNKIKEKIKLTTFKKKTRVTKIEYMETEHPHIIKIHGSAMIWQPVIKRKNFKVWILARMFKDGKKVEEIISNWPQLKPSEIFDALSYYYDHKEELDKFIKNYYKNYKKIPK
jgi:uncharacterized protein (DUF433 family)